MACNGNADTYPSRFRAVLATEECHRENTTQTTHKTEFRLEGKRDKAKGPVARTSIRVSNLTQMRHSTKLSHMAGANVREKQNASFFFLMTEIQVEENISIERRG